MASGPRALNRYDLLKIAGLIAITIGHLGAFQYGDEPWMRMIGRIAAPTFLFLVGYNRSYGFRWLLLAAAIVVTVGDGWLSGRWSPQNILWTILFGRMLLHWLDQRMIGPLPVLLACAVWYVPGLFVLDASTLGLVWMLFGRAMRREYQGREALVYGAIGFLGAAWQPLAFFDWPPLLYVLTVGLLAAWWWLVLWRFSPVPLKHDYAIGRFCSRHSLVYYVVHKIFLQGVHF